MKKVLLYSGGMDSWLIDKLWKPDIKLFVDLGTEECKIVRNHLPNDVIVVEVNLAQFELPGSTHTIRLRNLILCAIACNYGDVIGFGAVDGDLHFDGTVDFCNITTQLFNYVLVNEENKHVTVEVPYKNYTKEMLLQEYVNSGGDLATAYNETFSCYEPVNNCECGKCLSCRRKISAFKNLGYEKKVRN